MLFVDVTLENWCISYPELEVISSKCGKCGDILTADLPFIVKGYAGLTSSLCSCVDSQSSCMTKVSTTDEEFNRWRKLVSAYL